VAENCVDRHLPERSDAVAVHWEGEPGDRASITFGELDRRTRAFAAALAALGISAGERVALHLASIPEAVVALMACARLGAVTTVMPVTLPAEALADRLEVFRPRLVVTQDGAWRHGRAVDVKARADEALAALSEKTVETTVVVRRTGGDVDWFEGDRWYDELPGAAETAEPPVALPAADPLLVQYIAMKRHQPLGVVHSSAGLLVCAAAMHRHAFTLGEEDVLWTAVELSFVNGLVQGIFGPLACGMPTVLFEGTIDTPTEARAFEIIERYRVSTLFTTPSVVRHLRRGNEGTPSNDTSSLRLVITGGERLDPAESAWLRSALRPGTPPLVVNAWGQTETAGAVLLHPPPQGPGTLPDTGVSVVDAADQPVPAGEIGELVLGQPWPGFFLGIEGHPDPVARYWPRWSQGLPWYTTGDLARLGESGELEIVRRMDSVVKVSGQLVSLDDIGEALTEHPFVERGLAAQAVDPDGERILVAGVVLSLEAPPSPMLARDVRRHVYESLGGLARPGAVGFLEALPAGVPVEELRRALAAVGAARAPAESFEVSAAELAAALAGGRPGH
jgi:acetyl-CoA synthetase